MVTKGIVVLGGGVSAEGPWITPWDLTKRQAVVPFVTSASPRSWVIGLDGRKRGGVVVVIVDRVG